MIKAQGEIPVKAFREKEIKSYRKLLNLASLSE